MKFKKSLLFWGILILPQFLYSQIDSVTRGKAVAVLEFQGGWGIQSSEVASLTNRFRSMLVQSHTFKVVEREEMNEILKEQDFSLTDLCNTSECAVQVGQLLAVEYIFAGSVGKIGNTYTVDLRMINVTSGKIEKNKSFNHKGSTEGLIELMKEAAYGFAGLHYKKKSKTKWYWVVGATAVISGSAITFLNKGKRQKTGISPPTLPPTTE